jgi:hypothetical protein
MTLTWAIGIAVVVLVLAAVLLSKVLHKPSAADRASARLPLAVPVRLRLDGRMVELLSEDISRGGVCLVGEVRLSAGQPVEVEIALPAHSPVGVHGVVRWVQRGKVGVLFDMQDRRRIVIGDWIAAQQAAAGE